MRALIKVVRHQIDRHAIDDTQAIAAAFKSCLQQVVGKVGGTPLPTNGLAGIINHLSVQEWLFGNLNVVDIGIEVDRSRIIAHQQCLNNRPTQVSGGICPGNGLDGYRTVIKVDVAAGLILIGILDVVLRTRNQHFLKSPQILNIMGKLPHQNIKTVGILDPGFVIGIAFFGRTGTGDEQRRNNGKREKFFHHSGSACCVCCLQGPD